MEGTPRAAINFEQQYVTCSLRFYQKTGILGLICVHLGRKSEYRYIREMQTYLDHCETLDYIP